MHLFLPLSLKNLLYAFSSHHIGSNGAGKTTLLRILCGLDSQYTGSITLTESYDDDNDEVEGEEDEDDEEESKQVDVSSSYAKRKDEEGGKGKGVEDGDGGGRKGMKGAGKGHVVVDDIHMQKRGSHQRSNVTSSSSVMRDGGLESGPRSASRRSRSSVPPLSLSFFPSFTSSSSSSTTPSYSSPFTWSRDIAVSVLSFWIVTFAKARRFVTHAKRYIYPPKKPRVRRSVGWCAQEDALFEYLTVREHIELFDVLLGTYDTVSGDAVSPTTAACDSNSSKDNEMHNQGSGSESGVEKESEESVPKEETYLSKKLNQLLSYSVALGSDSNTKNAQTLVLTRLGMVEHADKMACELSGNRADSPSLFTTFFIISSTNFSWRKVYMRKSSD
jgi:ABC-type oligopeptide transport system ATPase subunit